MTAAAKAHMSRKPTADEQKAFTAKKISWLEQVARDHHRLPKLASPLCTELCHYFNLAYGEGARPWQDQIARALDVDRTAVNRTLTAVVARGHLRSKRQGRGKANVYFMVLDAAEAAASKQARCAPGRTSSAPSRCADFAIQDVQSGAHKVSSKETPKGVLKNPPLGAGEREDRLRDQFASDPGGAPLKGAPGCFEEPESRRNAEPGHTAPKGGRGTEQVLRQEPIGEAAARQEAVSVEMARHIGASWFFFPPSQAALKSEERSAAHTERKSPPSAAGFPYREGNLCAFFHAPPAEAKRSADISTHLEPTTRGESVEGDGSAPAAWREILACYRRGWPSDDDPKQIAIARTAYAKLIGQGTPAGEIVAAVKRWVAAADAPRYLPALFELLSTGAWQAEPPPKKQRQRTAAAASVGGGGALVTGAYLPRTNGKVDLARLCFRNAGPDAAMPYYVVGARS